MERSHFCLSSYLSASTSQVQAIASNPRSMLPRNCLCENQTLLPIIMCDYFFSYLRITKKLGKFLGVPLFLAPKEIFAGLFLIKDHLVELARSLLIQRQQNLIFFLCCYPVAHS